MWAARKFKNASVGKISLYVNVVVYASLLLMFDIEIVIYSLIYMVCFTLMMDRVHYQNITVRLMIFTKQEGIDQKILKQTGRGVTEWTGVGAYTKEETKIMVCCTNKFEVAEFVEIIHSIDPKLLTKVSLSCQVTLKNDCDKNKSQQKYEAFANVKLGKTQKYMSTIGEYAKKW